VRVETHSGAVDAATTAARWCGEMRKHEIDAFQAEISKTDALARELTSTFPQPGYLQLKLSVSQTFFMEGRPLRWDTAKKIILDSLARAVQPG
jgi:hypothetical protein